MSTATKPAKGKPDSKQESAKRAKGRKTTFAEKARGFSAASLDSYGKWIPVAMFADLIGVSQATVRAWERKGLLPDACFPPEADDRRLYFRVNDLQGAIRRVLPKTS